MSSRFGALESNAYGERYYPEINGAHFSKRASELQYNQYFPELLEEEDHLFILIGSDSGLLYQFLKQQDLPKHTHYVLIDFEDAVEHLDIPEEETRIEEDQDAPQILFVSDQFNLDNIAIEYMPYLIRRNVSLVRSLAAQDAKVNSLYESLRRHFEDEYSRLIRQEMVSLNSKPFTDAQLDNMADNLHPMITMRNRLEGSTALILGGGPTLDDAIEWIHQNQHKVVIFSAARIARRLIKEGINPDIFVSVDPHDVSFDNSKGIFSFSQSSLLVHSHHINPKILSQWSGVNAYLGVAKPWEREEENMAAPGPNVINTALHLAYELGCSTFIFSGVDMCFVGQQAFESGSDEAKTGGKFVFNEIQTVENNTGEMAQTQPMYALGRKTIELQVAQYKQARPATQFITLGKKSAKVEHVQYVDAAELVLEGNSIQFDIETMIEALRLTPEERQKRVNLVIKDIKKQIKRFYAVQKDAKSVLELVPKMFNEDGSEKPNIVQKFMKLKKSVDKGIAEDGDMLFHYESQHFTTNFKSIEDEESMSQNEVEEQLNGFYKGVKEASEQFHKGLLRACDRAELRLDELKGQKLSSCIEQWQALEQPGRALLWQQWHSSDENDQTLIKQQIAKFDELVESTQTTQLEELKKKSENLPGLFNRATKAMEDRDLEEVKDILAFLSGLDEQDGLADLIKFCKGIELELTEQPKEALALYQEVEYPSIRHQALKRASNVAIQLQDSSLNLQILEQLCAYSLDYMLPYSRLLDLIDQKPFSADILRMYLQHNPQNDSVKVQLAEKLVALEQPEEAREWLQQVLVSNPEHKTAQQVLALL